MHIELLHIFNKQSDIESPDKRDKCPPIAAFQWKYLAQFITISGSTKQTGYTTSLTFLMNQVLITLSKYLTEFISNLSI